MKPTTKRTILRWVHILFGLPLLGYIYGPPAETVQYLPYFRYIYMPVVLLSGLLMWKGAAMGVSHGLLTFLQASRRRL